MSTPPKLICWKCGDELPDTGLPIGRNDACNNCHAELHVCKMCEFYDLHISDSCREPIADSVNNKEKANFCGYFRPKPFAYQPADTHAQSAALAQLNTLFESGSKTEHQDRSEEESAASTNEKAKQQLDDLFSSD